LNREEDPIVPDLVGPGVNVISCIPGNKFAEMSGTSMATPHIAGLAALLLQAGPTATIDQVENAIFASCRLLPEMTSERANRGVPNAPAAFRALTGAELPNSARQRAS
jgi:subtilisin family serine protease